MPRTRLAIAHFDSTEAALEMRQALIAQGASGIELHTEAAASETGRCRLEVLLPATIERRLLDILLASEASRVDIHDADTADSPES